MADYETFFRRVAEICLQGRGLSHSDFLEIGMSADCLRVEDFDPIRHGDDPEISNQGLEWGSHVYVIGGKPDA